SPAARASTQDPRETIDGTDIVRPVRRLEARRALAWKTGERRGLEGFVAKERRRHKTPHALLSTPAPLADQRPPPAAGSHVPPPISSRVKLASAFGTTPVPA